MKPKGRWPETADELIEVQETLARATAAMLGTSPWAPRENLVIGGCFEAFARGRRGRGQADDRAWAAAVAWRPALSPFRRTGDLYRRSDDALRGCTSGGGPRRATDVDAQAVVAGWVSASYAPGLLALRQGPILCAAVASLDLTPDVLLVDATGLDHPRRAGLAVHLGAMTGLPTVGVTHRPLLAAGAFPQPVRGARSPVTLDGETVGYWVCTRRGARPVLVHAGWRTDPDTAAAVVLRASTEAARTPVPLQEARRVAREARAFAGTS